MKIGQVCGQNRSESVKTRSKSGQFGRSVPRNTKIPMVGRPTFPCFFLISLLVSFCAFDAFRAEQPRKSLEKKGKTPPNSKANRKSNPTSKEIQESEEKGIRARPPLEILYERGKRPNIRNLRGQGFLGGSLGRGGGCGRAK